MAPIPQNTQRLKKELDDLLKQLERVGDASQYTNFNAATASASDLKAVIREIKQDLKDITEGSGLLNNFSKSIKNILGDQNKLNNALEAGKGVVGGMVQNAKELAKSAQGYKKLSSEELETKMKQQQEMVRQAKLAQDQFKYKRNLTEEEKEIYAALKQVEKANKSITDEISKQLVLRKKEEDTAKLAGKALEGIAKIPLVGKFMDTKKGMEAINKAAEDGKGPFKALGAGISASFEGISKATIILAIIDYAIKALKFFKDLLLAASEQTASIRKSFAMSAEAAENMRDRLQQITKLQQDYNATSTEILTAQSEINKFLGTQFDLTKDVLGASGQLLRDYARAKDMLKLSEASLNGALKISLQTGKQYRETLQAITATALIEGRRLKTSVDLRKVMDDVLQASDEMRGSFGGTVEQITKGAIQLHQMGLNFQDIKQIQQGILDFETSFANELKAEILLGREFNMDRARYFAMTRQYVKLGEEIVAHGLTRAKLDRMTSFELEGQAAMYGVQSDKLYEIVTRQENLAKMRAMAQKSGIQLTKEEMENETKILEILKAKGVEREALNAQLGEEALKNLEAQSASEKFERAITALKDKLAGMVESGLIDRLAAMLERFVNVFGPSEATIQTSRLQNQVQGEVSSFSGKMSIKSENLPKVGNATASERLINDLMFYAEEGVPAATNILKALNEGKLAAGALTELNKAVQEDEESFFGGRFNLNAKMNEDFLNKYQIKVDDFVIQTNPKDSIRLTPQGVVGGTNLDGNNNSQPVFHAQIIMPDGGVLANTTFNYAQRNNYTM